MSLKGTVRYILKKITGLSFYTNEPFGADPFNDIKQRMTGYDFNIFLDVGANVGQTAKHIRAAFPNAVIHSVEPIKNTFQLLQQNTKGYNVSTHNIALGSKNETIEVNMDGNNTNSSINSLVSGNNEINSKQTITEKITVVTTADFCSSLGITHIDYLKIDAISFVEAEVSMNPGNTFHVSFEEVKKYLEQKNYFLFGIYEQVLEWKTTAPVLRRSNALFISGALAKQYTA
jgi:FkbM family methyltransferase